MKLNKVLWGLIGCGDVTEVKSTTAFKKGENSELIAVMRRTGELAKDYAARHGVPLFVAYYRRTQPRFTLPN